MKYSMREFECDRRSFSKFSNRVLSSDFSLLNPFDRVTLPNIKESELSGKAVNDCSRGLSIARLLFIGKKRDTVLSYPKSNHFAQTFYYARDIAAVYR